MSEKSTLLRLHSTIYPTSAVKEAAVAFDELVETEITRDGDYHQVLLRPRGADFSAERLLKEFANYALNRAARSQ